MEAFSSGFFEEGNVEQKFDFRSFRHGTELISGKPQGSVSVISGLGEAGNATTAGADLHSAS